MKFYLSALTLLTFSLAGISPTYATGDIEPKTPLEAERGPGGMDVPMEKLPKPTPAPSPTPKPKAPEKKTTGY